MGGNQSGHGRLTNVYFGERIAHGSSRLGRLAHHERGTNLIEWHRHLAPPLFDEADFHQRLHVGMHVFHVPPKLAGQGAHPKGPRA